MSDKPLSKLVKQGWEVAGFSSTDNTGTQQHNVLLHREGQHKILTVRHKVLGSGVVFSKLEV